MTRYLRYRWHWRVIPLALIWDSGPANCEKCISDEISEQNISIKCPVATIGGTLTFPAHKHDGPRQTPKDASPCVVVIGGTLSHTRDGAMRRDGVPQRDALKQLAHELARAGYASLRYDKVGYGESKPTRRWTGTFHDEADVAAAAINYAYGRDDFSQVAVAGESAGAYLACLAAAAGTEADAYIFLGGHCGPGEAIY